MNLLQTQARLRETSRIRIAEFSRPIAQRCLALLRDSDRSSSGQSLVETALLLPVLLMLLFNAVNFGYFFLVALNMAAAPRSGVVYSIQGYSSPASGLLPSAGPSTTAATVSYLTYQDMTGAIYSPAGTPIQVCSQALGLNYTGASTQAAKCASFGGAYSFPAAASDPESPSFVLNQVDVAYTFSPLINGTIFNIFILAAPVCSSSGGSVSCTFHRQVLMRAMN
jgi:Flp pilus assembly protein TadG